MIWPTTWVEVWDAMTSLPVGVNTSAIPKIRFQSKRVRTTSLDCKLINAETFLFLMSTYHKHYCLWLEYVHWALALHDRSLEEFIISH